MSSYRTGSGKYKLADKVVDGATVLINTVNIRFSAPAFSASIEVSRVSLVSKTPSWNDGPLRATSLFLPAVDAVLIFKQLSWDSVRIVADGLLNELSGIPVKLITNSGRVRLTLKKRLSDASVISTRFYALLDDLLWVLTLCQLEACIIFLRSLQQSIHLASEQRKSYAAFRAKRQALGVARTHLHPGNLNSKDFISPEAKLFRQHDVIETSYHLCLLRTEIHFFDETRSGSCATSVPNGYIQLHIYDAEIDWYPYHWELSPKIQWPGCREFQRSRKNWLENNPAFRLQSQRRWESQKWDSKSDQRCLTEQEPSILQSLIVLRVADFDVSLVSFPTTVRGKNEHKIDSSRFSDEVPLHKNLFIGSDKTLHCLPANTYLLTIELLNSYRPGAVKLNESSSNMRSPPLPCVLFVQLKPVYLRFHADTVIWLNTFLVTLQQNLDVFLKYQTLWALSESSPDTKCYHIRGEMLMPRVIFPLNDSKSTAINTDRRKETTIPDVLVIQADEVILQLLTPPLPSHTVAAIERLFDAHVNRELPDPRPVSRDSHKALTGSKFYLLANGDSNELDPDTTLWCLHIPHMWSEFLIVNSCSMNESSKHRDPPPSLIYRQCLLESVPLTFWITVPFTSGLLGTIEVLINLGSSFDPLDVTTDVFDQSTPFDAKCLPVKCNLGTSPTSAPSYSSPGCSLASYPSAIDQIRFMLSLFDQACYVLDHLALEALRSAQPNFDKIWSIRLLPVSHIELILFLPSENELNEEETLQNVAPSNTNVSTPANLEHSDPSPNLSPADRSAVESLSNNCDIAPKSCTKEQHPITPSSGSMKNSFLSLHELSSKKWHSTLSEDGSSKSNPIFLLNDTNSSSSDDLSLPYRIEYSPAHSETSSSLISEAEETGIELTASEDVHWDLRSEVDSTSQSSANDHVRTLIPMRLPAASPRAKSSSSLCLCVSGVTLSTDASNSEFRAWLTLDDLNFMNPASVLSSCSIPNASKSNPLWSFFWSATSSITETSEGHRLHNDIYAFGDLLSDWRLEISQVLIQFLQRVTLSFSESGSGNCVPIINEKSSTKKLKLFVDLSAGDLQVDMASCEPEKKAHSKIFLDRGLRISYDDKDDTFRIGRMRSESNVDSTTAIDLTSSVDQSLSSQEIVRLKSEVERLSAQVERLKAELENNR